MDWSKPFSHVEDPSCWQIGRNKFRRAHSRRATRQSIPMTEKLDLVCQHASPALSICRSRSHGKLSVKATEFDLFRKCAKGSRSTDAYPSNRRRTQRSGVYSWPNHSFLEKENGFRYPRISALILSREKDTTAKTGTPERPCGERSPKDWRHGLLRTLTPAQRLSQQSRVSATANPWSFDRDSAKAHSE